jgi:hypothetical protein
MKRPKLLVISGGMSAVTEVRERPATDETAPASHPPGSALSRTAPTVGLAAALVAIAFITGGGVDQNVASSGNTWAEIGLTAAGAVAVGTGLLRRAPGERRSGWITGAMMALLFADTAASIAWSWAPDASWIGASQMLAYLSVFAGAIMLARPWARGWATVVGGLALWSVTLCGRPRSDTGTRSRCARGWACRAACGSGPGATGVAASPPSRRPRSRS